MKHTHIGGLVFATCLAASSGAFAKTIFLSVSLADPTTLSLGNSQRDIAVTSLSFSTGLIAIDPLAYLDGYNFIISALEKGTMTYQPVCSGRGCRPPPRASATWTQGNYDAFSNTYGPFNSISTDLFTAGDVLDATFNFVIPGGPTASPSSFNFSFDFTNSLIGPYTLTLKDTTTGSVISPNNGNYSLGADGYTLELVGTYDLISSSRIQTNLPTTAAVPEPGTYSLLLAGLGLIGVMERRRKAKQQ